MRQANAGRVLTHIFMLLSLVSFSVSVLSCGTKKQETPVTPPNVGDSLKADSIVEEMYRLFIDEHYDAYAKMQAGCDEKPQEYVDQTVILLKLLRQRMDSLHHGPKNCRLVRYERHGEDYFDAFLEVQFNDTTSEVILLPMLRQNGKWKMR